MLRLSILIAFGILSAAVTAEPHFFMKEWYFGNDRTIDSTVKQGSNNEFVYYTCGSYEGDHLNCTITLEYVNANNYVFKDRCGIHLKTNRRVYKMNSLELESVLDSKVIFSYIESSRNPEIKERNLCFGMIDMANCKHYESKILLRKPTNLGPVNNLYAVNEVRSEVLQYQNGSYDVFVMDHNLCNGSRCRYSINGEGNIVKGPLPYLFQDISHRHVKVYPTSIEDSYFGVVVDKLKFKNSDVSILFMKPEADFRELHYFKFWDNDKHALFDVDVKDDILSVCWTSVDTKYVNSTKINCKKFNSQEQQIFNETFELPYLLKDLKVKNVGADGFLLLTEECLNQDCNKGFQLYIRHIKNNGSHSRTMEIIGFKSYYSFIMNNRIMSKHITLDGKGNVCVSVMLNGKAEDRKHVRWQILRDCFSEENLHMK